MKEELFTDAANVQDAISYFRKLSQVNSADTSLDVLLAVNSEYCYMAMAALTKQIPVFVEQEDWTVSRCPNCDCELGEYIGDGYAKNYTYLDMCTECGQKLTWEDPDENTEKETNTNES